MNRAEGELVEVAQAQPKFYLNGFPKAGLHLLERLVRPILSPMPHLDIFGKKGAWCGSFRYHSWSAIWANMEMSLYKLATIWPGRYLKGHLGWHERFGNLFQEAGISVALIYRDLRDVAVSQAYHILDENDVKFVHLDKDEYRALGSFEEVLKAVIVGLGEKYAGLVERWELFAPWLEKDWVLSLKFEDVLVDPEAAGAAILNYAAERTARILKGQIALDSEDVAKYAEEMAKASRETEKSPTFRKGIAGGWVEYWTPGVDKVFRETGGEEWLERLGYESSPVLPIQEAILPDDKKHYIVGVDWAA